MLTHGRHSRAGTVLSGLGRHKRGPCCYLHVYRVGRSAGIATHCLLVLLRQHLVPDFSAGLGHLGLVEPFAWASGTLAGDRIGVDVGVEVQVGVGVRVGVGVSVLPYFGFCLACPHAP